MMGASNQPALAPEVVFIADDEPQSTHSTIPPQQNPTRSKAASEHFKLPEGLNCLNLYTAVQ